MKRLRWYAFRGVFPNGSCHLLWSVSSAADCQLTKANKDILGALVVTAFKYRKSLMGHERQEGACEVIQVANTSLIALCES
jgi:hypothetical protein